MTDKRVYVKVDGKPVAIGITPVIQALIDQKLSEVIKKKSASGSATLWFNGAIVIAAVGTYVLNEEMLSNPTISMYMVIAVAIANKILRVFKTDSAVTLN